jgi:pyruvate/oxaloacetate carboxyltransferase
MITAQVKDLCYGLYGKTAVPIDAEVQKEGAEGVCARRGAHHVPSGRGSGARAGQGEGGDR